MNSTRNANPTNSHLQKHYQHKACQGKGANYHEYRLDPSKQYFVPKDITSIAIKVILGFRLRHGVQNFDEVNILYFCH
jgi:hypothetical protein